MPTSVADAPAGNSSRTRDGRAAGRLLVAFLLVKKAGFEPLGLVIGSSIYYPRTFAPGLDQHLRLYFVDLRWFAKEYAAVALDTYTVDTILGARDEIRQKAKSALAQNLTQYHIIVDDIYIANISFSPEFQAAIEAKQVAQQQVQTEQQVLAQKQIQAQQVVVAAQGQADAQVTLAKGQSESNRLIAQSLSDPVLQYQLINKLSDKINVMLVPSGNGFILDLKSLTGQTVPSPAPSTAP